MFRGRIYDLNLDVIPLDDTLLTMNDGLSKSELFSSKEFNSVNRVAESINKMQMVFGKSRAFFAKGPAAKLALEIAKREEKIHHANFNFEKGRSLGEYF